MSKYIIKNCPAYDNRIWQEPTCNRSTKDCKDITDCLLKRIVGKCNKQLNGIKIGTGTKNDIIANNILKLLEIEECKNEN